MRECILPFLVLAVLFVPSSIAAQDYVLSLPDEVGELDDSVEIAVTLTNTGDDVEAYEFGVCHDDEVLRIGALDIVEGSDIDGLAFEIHVIELDGAMWSVSAILDTGEVLEPGPDLELYVATYELDAIGSSDLTFCDTLIPRSVTVDGEEIEPDVEDGSIEVLGVYVLSVNEIEGAVGEAATVAVQLTCDDDVNAYAFDVCHDSTLLEIGVGDVDFGVSTDDITFDTHTLTVEADGWSVAAVVDMSSAEVIAEGQNNELYEATYELLEEGLAELTFCGELLELDVTPAGGGGTAVYTVEGAIDAISGFGFLRGDVDGDGHVAPLADAWRILAHLFGSEDAPPCLEAADVDNDGAFNLFDVFELLDYGFDGGAVPAAPGVDECGTDPDGGDLGCADPPADCSGIAPSYDPDPDYVLSLADEVDVDAGTIEVTVSLSNSGEDLDGWQWGVCHDADLVSIDEGDVTMGVSPSDLNDGDGPDYYVVNVHDSGWTVAALGGITSTEALPAELDQEMNIATYQNVIDDPEATFEFCSTLGDPVVEVRLIAGGVQILPECVGCDGGGDSSQFLRGDINGDGDVTSLTDALSLLLWAFADGAEPTCRDAADVDDNGIVSALVDALVLLDWSFSDGDAPSDPGPDECGVDPTDDDETCEEPPEDCL